MKKVCDCEIGSILILYGYSSLLQKNI